MNPIRTTAYQMLDFNRGRAFLGGSALLAAAALCLLSRPVRANDEVFHRLTLSSVLVWNVSGDADEPSISTGSGWVLDYRNGYVVTNEHVVRGREKVGISFPQFRNGKVIRTAKHYLSDARVHTAEVLVTDPLRDLAIVKVERVPSYMRALTIDDRYFMYDKAYTIGHLVDQDDVFIPREGKVLHSGFSAEMVGDEPLIGELIYTSSDFLPGNSGGPIVNEFGMVFGVVTAINPTEHYNINIGRVELEHWLGLQEKYDLATEPEFFGHWIATVDDFLKSEDETGALVPLLPFMPPEGHKKSTRAVGVRVFVDGFGEQMTVTGYGRTDTYRYRILDEEERKGLFLVELLAPRRNGIAIYHAGSELIGEDNEDVEKEHPGTEAIGQEPDKSDKAPDGKAVRDPVPSKDDDHDLETSQEWEWSDEVLAEFDAALLDDLTIGEDLLGPDIFAPRAPTENRSSTWPKPRPRKFGNDKKPPVMFGWRSAAKLFESTTKKNAIPHYWLYLASNNPEDDWYKAKWTLMPYEYQGNVVKDLDIHFGDNRPVPSAAQLPSVP